LQWYSHRNLNVDRIAGLAVSPTGEYAATYQTALSRTTVKLWRISTGELVNTFAGHTAPTMEAWRHSPAYDVRWPFGIHLTGLAFSTDGTKLAASSLDGTVLIWPVP
jgi:WD40 repeat protein